MKAEKFEFAKNFIANFQSMLEGLNLRLIDENIELLRSIKQNEGRVFVLGMGGSAANAQHLVNDLRKLCSIETYSATDNVAEFSALVNDEGLANSFREYLKSSKLSSKDLVFVLSVGGGNRELDISSNICLALDYADRIGSKITGIVGLPGYTYQKSKSTIVMPETSQLFVTPFAETLQTLIWHLFVTDERLKTNRTKW
jgi:D-sedoheptulose 7-phosphate isomerase